MNPKLKEKVRESVTAALPITAIVLLVSILLVPLELGPIVLFLTGAVMLIVGLVALSSIGPILAVLILGSFFKPDQAEYTLTDIETVTNTRDVANVFLNGIPKFAKEVAISLLL